MKKLFFVLFTLAVLSNHVFAQDEKYIAPNGLNNWYVELGGSALFYSFNYEKYLYKNASDDIAWVGRVGAGFNPIDFPDFHKLLNKVVLSNNSFMFPFTSSVIIGGGENRLELGAGFTMITKDFSKLETIPNIVLGLRVMETNRVCFRVSYIPLIQNGEVIHWLGVSLGKNYSGKK